MRAYYIIVLILFSSISAFGQSDLRSLYDSARISQNLQLAQEVNRSALTAGDKKTIADSYYLVAFLQKRHEAYYDAVSNYFEALIIYSELENKDLAADVIENIANIYHITGFHQKALEYYFDALRLKQSINDFPAITKLNAHIGLQYMELNQYQEAVRYFELALTEAKKQNITTQLYWINNQLGRLHSKSENYQEAKKYYTGSLEYANNSHRKSSVFNNVGYMHLLMKDSAAAYENFKIAWKIISKSDSTHSSYFTGRIFSNLGKIYEVWEQDSAYWFYKRSYEFLKQHPLSMSQHYFDVCKKLKSISRNEGNLQVALSYSEDIDALTADLLRLRTQLNDLYNRYQVEAATYRYQHEEKAKALERQMVIDRYIKWALSGVLLLLLCLIIILYRKNRKIKFAKDTAKKIYQVINS